MGSEKISFHESPDPDNHCKMWKHEGSKAGSEEYEMKNIKWLENPKVKRVLFFWRQQSFFSELMLNVTETLKSTNTILFSVEFFYLHQLAIFSSLWGPLMNMENNSIKTFRQCLFKFYFTPQLTQQKLKTITF